MKKLDFTKEKLRVIILELANNNGYESPSTYLNELLIEVKKFDSFDFECSFYLNIYSLCNEHADKFWNDLHKQDILNWLKKSRIMTKVFDKMWERDTTAIEAKAPEAINNTVTQKPLNYNEQALVYIFDLLAIDVRIPRNPITKQYDKIALKAIGEKKNLTPDTFYRSVKRLCGYNLNKTKDLDSISARWYEVLKHYSQNYEQTRKYLIQQSLSRE